jgi:hypothetical protein
VRKYRKAVRIVEQERDTSGAVVGDIKHWGKYSVRESSSSHLICTSPNRLHFET